MTHKADNDAEKAEEDPDSKCGSVVKSEPPPLISASQAVWEYPGVQSIPSLLPVPPPLKPDASPLPEGSKSKAKRILKTYKVQTIKTNNPPTDQPKQQLNATRSKENFSESQEQQDTMENPLTSKHNPAKKMALTNGNLELNFGTYHAPLFVSQHCR